MAYLTYTLTSGWSAANRFTAVGSVPLEVVNTMDAGNIHYVVTDDDTVPGLPVPRAARVASGRDKAISLLDGERLWIASEAKNAVCTVNY